MRHDRYTKTYIWKTRKSSLKFVQRNFPHWQDKHNRPCTFSPVNSMDVFITITEHKNIWGSRLFYSLYSDGLKHDGHPSWCFQVRSKEAYFQCRISWIVEVRQVWDPQPWTHWLIRYWQGLAGQMTGSEGVAKNLRLGEAPIRTPTSSRGHNTKTIHASLWQHSPSHNIGVNRQLPLQHSRVFQAFQIWPCQNFLSKGEGIQHVLFSGLNNDNAQYLETISKILLINIHIHNIKISTLCRFIIPAHLISSFCNKYLH